VPPRLSQPAGHPRRSLRLRSGGSGYDAALTCRQAWRDCRPARRGATGRPSSAAISPAHARTRSVLTGPRLSTGSESAARPIGPKTAAPRAPTARATRTTLQSSVSLAPVPVGHRPRPIGPAQKSQTGRAASEASWRARNPPQSDRRPGTNTPLPRMTAEYGVTSVTSDATWQSTANPA